MLIMVKYVLSIWQDTRASNALSVCDEYLETGVE